MCEGSPLKLQRYCMRMWFECSAHVLPGVSALLYQLRAASLELRFAIVAHRPMYAMEETRVDEFPGKGRFLVANVPIKASLHRPFLAEEPLIKKTVKSCEEPGYEAEVAALVTELNDVSRKTFFELNCHPLETATPGKIWQVSHFDIEGDDAVYPHLSLVDHSCFPNTAHAWNETEGKGELHALRDIAAGERITVTKVEPLDTESRRHAHLHYFYGFRCNSVYCVGDSSLSDKRRIALSHSFAMLDPIVDKFAAVANSASVVSCSKLLAGAAEARELGLRLVGHEIMRLVERERLVAAWDRVSRALDAATFLLIGHPEYQQAWAAKCLHYTALGSCEQDTEEMQAALAYAKKTPLPQGMMPLSEKELCDFGSFSSAVSPGEDDKDIPVQGLHDQIRKLCMPE
jgi:hypothetical protein